MWAATARRTGASVHYKASPVGWKWLTFELGRFRVEFKHGKLLYKEDYIGPEPSTTESSREPSNWVPHSAWAILRGDGRVLSKKWWRFLLGRGYIHFRTKPLLWSWSYYNGRWSIDIAWRASR
jgi:hypothetical protein